MTDAELDVMAAGLAARLTRLVETVDRVERTPRVLAGVPAAWQDGRWRSDAACADSFSPDFWADIETQVGARRRMRETAKLVCSVCKVQPECLTYALETKQPYGVWGGLLPEERRELQSVQGSNGEAPSGVSP